jgi:hypothetical protein
VAFYKSYLLGGKSYNKRDLARIPRRGIDTKSKEHLQNSSNPYNNYSRGRTTMFVGRTTRGCTKIEVVSIQQDWHDFLC